MSASLKSIVDWLDAALDVRADACIACGVCEGNCPFGVPIIERMEAAAELFS